MAWETEHNLDIPGRSASSVSPISFSAATGAYVSGGIVQYTAVKPDTIPGDIVAATAATVPCFGILQNTSLPRSGVGAIGPSESAQVRLEGITKLVAGSSLSTPGTMLMNDGSGQGILATTTNYGIGMSLNVATAAGDIISVWLIPGFYQK